MIRHYLALVLISIWGVASPGHDRPQSSSRAIVRSFVHRVELHIRDHWSISIYAEALGATANRLNSATQRATVRTPKELIHERLMTEPSILHDNSGLGFLKSWKR